MRKRGVSPTEDGTAIAACILDVPNDVAAIIFISWDDELTLICNDQTMELGNHYAFRTQTVSVNLSQSQNRIILILSNTVGYNHGGWAFAFKAHTEDGVQLIPGSHK